MKHRVPTAAVVVFVLVVLLAFLGASGYEHPEFSEPEALYSEDGHLSVTLTVTVGRVREGPFLFNARMYNGSMPGPTLHVKPGDHLSITVVNNLGAQNYTGYEVNSLHNFNSTNIHTHGLHVPSTSDNVFLNIEPNERFTFEYDICADHYPGSLFYHPHRHGSAGIQLYTMHGALIVEPPNDEYLDSFLAGLEFKVVMFEHMYAELSVDPAIEITYTSIGDLEYWGDSEVHYDLEVETEGFEINDSKYNVLVNGRYQPVMTVNQDEWFGMRLFGMQVAYNLQVQIESCEVVIVARDGVYLEEVLVEEILWLGPANRIDVAVRCREAGFFRVTNEVTSKFDWICRPTDYDHCFDQDFLLFMINVNGSSYDADSTSVSFPENWTCPQRPYYLQDLAEIPREYLNGSFEIVGSLDLTLNEKRFFSEYDYMYGFAMRPHGVYELNLTMDPDGASSAHPMHIHVNHFQIVNEQVLNYTEDYTTVESENVTSLYRIGEHRDTVMIFANRILTIRMSTFGFTGSLAVHCHYLTHSDLGMIGTIAVSDGVNDPLQFHPQDD